MVILKDKEHKMSNLSSNLIFNNEIEQINSDLLFDHLYDPDNVWIEDQPDYLIPRIDLVENNQGYIIRADLPGIQPDNIGISLEDNFVTIETGINQTFNDADGLVLRRERHFGRFIRSISLTQDIDTDKATAELNDGILTLYIPKLYPGEINW